MLPALKKDKLYTYADYARWDDDVKCELIDGVVYLMAPGASESHQDTSGDLFRQLANFLYKKPCKVFHPPFDVCLNADGDNEKSVFQPDLFVVCDRSKLDGKRCNGAPDMVIEILSPSTASRDILLKYNKYMLAGVREYWIVDTENKIVRVCILKEGKYETTDFINPDEIPVTVLDGCLIDMKSVFKQVEGEKWIVDT